MPDLNQRMTGSSGATDPVTGAVAINYSGGDQVLSTTSRGLYIGTAGNLAVVMQDLSEVTYNNLAAGVVYPFAVRTIRQTGSTAAGVVLL